METKSPFKKQEIKTLPNEQELLAEIEEQERYKQLQNEIEEKRKEAEYMKDRMLEKRIKAMEDKKKELFLRLNEVDNYQPYDDTEEKVKIIQLKRNLVKQKEEEDELNNEIKMLRKEHEFEKIVRKKLELEKIIEEKKKLSETYKKINVELDVIIEEKESRDMDNVKLLEKAVKRANLIQGQLNKGALSDKDKALLAETYFEQSKEAQLQRERLLEEIQAKKEQEIQKVSVEAKEKIKNLNDLRYALIEKQEKLLKEKAIHHELLKKGNDYLVNIEMGDAPPKEIIKKNIRVDPNKYSNPLTISLAFTSSLGNQIPLEEILKSGKTLIKASQKKIEEVQQEQKEVIKEIEGDQVYDGKIQQWLAKKNAKSVYLARSMVDIIIDLFWREIDQRRFLDEEFKKQAPYFESKSMKIQKKFEMTLFESATKLISDEIFERVTLRIIREVAFEMYKLNENAKMTTVLIIMRALKIERNIMKSEEEMQEGFFALRGQDMKKKKEKFKFFFQDRNEIKPGELRLPKRKDQPLIGTNTDPAKTEYGITLLEYDKDCVENLGDYRLRDMEMRYWSKIELALKDESIIDLFTKAKGILKLKLSINGKLLACLLANNVIALVNLTYNPPVIQLVSDSANSMLNQLKFSFDHCSQLLALDTNGQLRAFLLSGNPMTKMATLPWMTNAKDADLRPLEMQELYKLDWKYLYRTDKPAESTKDTLQISYCEFFPAFTLLGFQPSIVVGTKGGMIVKYNHTKKPKIITTKKPTYFTTNIGVFAKSEPDNDKIDELKLRPNQKSEHFYREYFNGHKAEIVYIGYIENPETIITVDKNGFLFIWNYAETSIGGDGYYYPQTKFKFVTDGLIFQKMNERNQVFPPKKLAKNQIAEEQKKQYEQYDQSIDFTRRIINTKKVKNFREVMTYMKKLPNDGEKEMFKFVTFDDNERKVVTEEEQEFQALKRPGFVWSAASSNNNRIVYVQIVLPNRVKQESNDVIFVGFNTSTERLKRLKITVEIPKGPAGLDFLILDNFSPVGASYILLLIRDTIHVFSLSTGSIVRKFETFTQEIQKLQKFKPSIDLLDLHKNNLYMASNTATLIWKFYMEDSNDQDFKDNMKNMVSNEFKRFMFA